jgi:hypothetical protein
MVTVKFTIRLNMMNVERLACFLCGYAAALAGKIISFACHPASLLPPRAAPISMTSKPCRAIFPVHIPRFSLPIKTAVGIAKYILPNPARESHNRTSTIAADVFGTFHILRVSRPAWGMFTPILFDTGNRTKVGIEPFNAVIHSCYRLPTVATWNLYASSTGFIPTSKATILLARVIAWRQEFLFALQTWLRSSFSPRLIATAYRTKSHLAISAFLNRLTTSFACCHATIIA